MSRQSAFGRFAEQLLRRITDAVVEVGLTGDQDQLGQFDLAEVLPQFGDQVGGQRVGLLAHGVSQPEGGHRPIVKDIGPDLRGLEGFNLGLGYSSSSRRDDMARQSGRALIHDRRSKEDQLLHRR